MDGDIVTQVIGAVLIVAGVFFVVKGFMLGIMRNPLGIVLPAVGFGCIVIAFFLLNLDERLAGED